MGSVSSSFVAKEKDVLEGFMIYYMNQKGPTPYNMSLFPGSPLSEDDSKEVVRHKFRKALRHQRELNKALKQIDTRLNLGKPLMMQTGIPLEGDYDGMEGKNKDKNMNICTDRQMKQKPRSKPRPSLAASSGGLGTLDRLISGGFSSEELMSIDCKKYHQQFSSHKSKEKRCRSRPEKSARIDPNALRRREIKSETRVMIMPADTQSETTIQRITLEGEKRRKRTWPPKENVKRVLRDERNRPTTYFLGRFRKDCNSSFVEFDYRFNSKSDREGDTVDGAATSPEYFNCTGGDLADLLGPAARISYQADKINNNLNMKQVFLNNLVYFFNNFEGRIWWNGYLLSIEGPVENRIPLASIQMDPPTLTFELNGLHHVSASRTGNELTINGRSEVDPSALHKSFRLRGKTEQDIKFLNLHHEPGTVQLGITIPLLSGIPVSKTKLKLSQSKSKGDGAGVNPILKNCK